MRSRHWLTILKVCVSLTVFARGWLTWKWDSPIRGLIWNEGWWSDRIDWQSFALTSDAAITRGLEILGVCLMLSAVVPWFTTVARLKWTVWLLVPMAGALLLDAFARFIDSGNQLGMAIEHTLQWGCPLLLLMALRKGAISRAWIAVAAGATVLTFLGHGLYAVGFHAVPLKYQTMTTSLTGLSGSGVFTFLTTFGVLDFVAAAALLIAPLRRYALYYLIAWGALTALARIASAPSFDPWLMETAVRSSHWIVPLLIFLYWRNAASVGLKSA
ncbi:MAG: hypothetical protein P1U86_17520 [Verrucomicrobiales bacterium]|nr:hypothetical protein [Verrucomicrobiales bacterium]